MSLTPAVAIVGRPNVGKSTLFNRLVGRRRAIVHDQPGVTRDRIVELAEVAPGRVVQWVDTGGLVPGDDPLGINEQVLLAARESDLLVLVVDGKQGLTTADERVRDTLRRLDKPTLLVVNKSDTRTARDGWAEFYALGTGEPLPVSAEHGLGIADLRQRILAALPEFQEPEPTDPTAIPVAVVGRPNVGKSSLVNRIVGSERTLVSPIPGTTRDPVDTLIRRGDRSYILVDTAGLRRRAKVSGTPEDLAVMLARRQIERCEVALLVIEAQKGVTSGDLAVAGAIWESGRAAVVAINKWDLLDDAGRERLDSSWPRLAEILADPPRVNLSAASGRGVEKIFERIEVAHGHFHTQFTTGELNRFLEGAIAQHTPPSEKGRAWKLYYATQVSTAPPTLMLFANRTLAIEHPYRRYLENRLRETFELPGIPIRLVVRKRSTSGPAAS